MREYALVLVRVACDMEAAAKFYRVLPLVVRMAGMYTGILRDPKRPKMLTCSVCYAVLNPFGGVGGYDCGQGVTER